MTVDLVVLNMRAAGYLQELGERILEALFASSDAGFTDRPGGVFIRRGDTIGDERLLMLRATARVHVPCDGRPLGRIVDAARMAELVEAEDVEAHAPPLRRSDRQTPPSLFATRRTRTTRRDGDGTAEAGRAVARREPPGLALDPPVGADNGYGGITPEGDYIVRVRGDRVPPAPWANVVANPFGGFVVTERGGGFTWAQNSHFFRLTPWHNDPVADPVSEVIYLRDEEDGSLWSATPAPVRHDAHFLVRHGAGTSSFEQRYAEIATVLTLGLSEHDAVKVSVLRITNHDTRPRRLTLTAYVEWTLGVLREHTQHQVLTTFDAERHAILARNFFDPVYAGHVAFCALSEPVIDHTADRREFLGRNGSPGDPVALRGGRLSGTSGAAVDPCAALRCALSLAPGETREVAVLLGAADGHDAALRAIDEHRGVTRAREAIAHTVAQWTNRLSLITVRTPEPSFDAMLNRWTLYQALACRMWARSALYQSSGAYGFRDQLQDVMAFVYAEPGIARDHIVRAAARQFVEGDVQHWWHPQTGRGVRTRFSDDLVWLPHVVDHYVRVTGDAAVLDEVAPFLTMRALEPHEHEVYDLPQTTEERATVYEHCLRALRRACTAGEHGLPLIGSGDWNDGMNRVGIEGRGESIWLAWFLITTLRAFAEHAAARGDAAVAGEFRARADGYGAAVEANGWDGRWYRRAYFDDGTPLGSAQNDECRIDSIAQSWSVISGAGDPARQEQAMRSLEEHLVRDDARLLMLLTPPFDESPNDPGYIKGYLPGVRENGAQYTHAALWAVLATAIQGNGDRAFELYQMINPLTHAGTPEQVETYKVEPYVVAADVYTAEGQLGRGGWTWYTGSASWMYRVGLEAILGVTKRGDTLTFAPRVPHDWPEFTVEYRCGRTVYVIVVHDPGAMNGGGVEVSVDGRVISDSSVTLIDDGVRHDIVIRPRLTLADAARRDRSDRA
jgi:cyclic beta-1,2-glucan synthetase